VIVICFEVEFPASGRSVVRASPTDCGVSEYDHEAWIMRRPWPTLGLLHHDKKSLSLFVCSDTAVFFCLSSLLLPFFIV
jgi:hypothetical protein